MILNKNVFKYKPTDRFKEDGKRHTIQITSERKLVTILILYKINVKTRDIEKCFIIQLSIHWEDPQS